MKPLRFPKYAFPKNDKGITVAKWSKGERIKCNKCGKKNKNNICKLSGKDITYCSFPESHRFASYKYHPEKGDMRPIRTWNKELRDYDEFKKLHDLECTSHTWDTPKEKETKIEVIEKYVYLDDIIPMYTDFLKGFLHGKERDRAEFIKRSDQSDREHILILEETKLVLKQNNIDPYSFNIETFNKIHRKMMTDYYTHKLENKTYNNKIARLNSIFKDLKKHWGYVIDDGIADLKNKKVAEKENMIILKETFHSLISIHKQENGYYFKQTGKKVNMYREWQLFVWELALHIGSRVNELSELLIENDKDTYYKIRNSKRSQKAAQDNVVYYVEIPINDRARELINILKGDRKTGFLIEPDSARKTVYNLISRGFNHFIEQATNEPIKFYDTRNTWMTKIALEHGIDTLKILGVHQNTAISIKNYISKTILTKGIKMEDFV